MTMWFVQIQLGLLLCSTVEPVPCPATARLALQHNPQDYALYNNISLVALKMGDTKQVGTQRANCACYVLAWSLTVLPSVHLAPTAKGAHAQGLRSRLPEAVANTN